MQEVSFKLSEEERQGLKHVNKMAELQKLDGRPAKHQIRMRPDPSKLNARRKAARKAQRQSRKRNRRR